MFNLIPVLPFDGAKVIAWNKNVYIITIILASVLFFGGFFIWLKIKKRFGLSNNLVVLNKW